MKRSSTRRAHSDSGTDLPGTEVRPWVASLDLEWEPLDLEREVLREAGFDLVELHCQTEDDVIEGARGAVAVLTEIAPLSRRVLEGLRGCRVVSEFGVGTDYIDLDAAQEFGMVVTSVPDYCTDEVADHTLTLALVILRRIFEQRQAVRAGTWSSLAAGAVPRLRDCTWGIIGYGRIGRAVAQRVAPLGCALAVHDPCVSPDLVPDSIQMMSLDRLLRSSDIISLHAPRAPGASAFLSVAEFQLMNPRTVLVNVARGAHIDERALVEALDHGRLAGAGLDVLIQEPPRLPHSLVDHPRAVVTPHMAWYSQPALTELRLKGIRAVLDVLAGLPPKYPVLMSHPPD